MGNAEPPSDEELIRAIQRGESRAFDALYLRHRDWVHALALRFCRDREDALDVLQDVFLYLARKLPTLVLTSQLRTLLYPTVKHLALNKRRGRHRTLPIESAGEVPAPESHPTTDEPSLLLRSLPPEQREVVELRFLEEFDLKEIARALAIPLGTVKSRLHNALEALRRSHRKNS